MAMIWGRGVGLVRQRDDDLAGAPRDLIDRAVFDTLATGWEVFVTDAATLGTVTGVTATLRY